MIQAALRDKSYRGTPLGLLVGRYIRWCRNERGLVSQTTIRDYEYTLARMCVTLSNREPEGVTLEDLRIVIDLWATNEPNTRKKVISAIRGFWRWAEDEGHVERSPAVKLRTPKVRQKAIELLPTAVDTQLLAGAETIRDKVALIALLDFGLRKSELGGIQVRDVDLVRRTLTVRCGKGQKHRILPIRGRFVLAFEEYLMTPLRRLERVPEEDDFLLYPEWRKGGKVYGTKPKRPMSPQSLHRWWYEHLQRAGLVDQHVEKGLNMHRARHTFATELRRNVGDIGVVQHMLGHSDVSTTERYYGHYDLSDLARAMERFSRARENRPK